jgi:hypothetical protein
MPDFGRGERDPPFCGAGVEGDGFALGRRRFAWQGRVRSFVIGSLSLMASHFFRRKRRFDNLTPICVDSMSFMLANSLFWKYTPAVNIH